MYKKIMVFGMVLLIMLCTPLPSYSTSMYSVPAFPSLTNIVDYESFKSPHTYNYIIYDKANKIFYNQSYTSPMFYNPDLNKLEFGPDFINGKACFYTYSSSSNKWMLTENSNDIHPLHSITFGTNFVLVRSSSPIYFLNSQDIYYNVSESQSFDGRITLPANDGYKDNGTTFTFWHWYQLPSGVDSSDVKIDPYIDDSKDTYYSAAVTLHQKIPNTSKWNLNINLTVREYGPHTYKVVFKQISTGKVLGTLTRTFESLEGFIDENGDGLDDRTNQPPYTPLDPPGTNPGTSPEWDGTILGFFKYLIDSVKYYVENIVSGINTTMGAIGKVPQIMGTILNFPEPLTALLIFGVTCTIILAIFRR